MISLFQLWVVEFGFHLHLFEIFLSNDILVK